MSEENPNVKIDEENISLADLAGLNMDDVAEKRGESLPKGVYLFEVDGENPPKLIALGEGDKARPGVRFECKVIDVVTVTDPEFKDANDSLIGRKHNETFFLSTTDSLGYLKAFIKDIGAPYASKLSDLLAGTVGTRFQAPIGKRKDKNDADIIYTHIVRGNKMKPAGSAVVSEVAAKVA